jgi:hypothetical protein
MLRRPATWRMFDWFGLVAFGLERTRRWNTSAPGGTFGARGSLRNARFAPTPSRPLGSAEAHLGGGSGREGAPSWNPVAALARWFSGPGS